MNGGEIFPALALAHLAPDFLDTCSDKELAILPYLYDVWLRPEQHIPRYGWRTYGQVAGRGFGKTFGFGVEINRRVQAGEISSMALMAPNEDRVGEVQVATLIETSPPWFRAETYHGSVRWPNGLVAEVFTPMAPGRPRSGNFDVSWLTELVDWNPPTRREAFDNITTATRTGPAQVLWDTTSKGLNEIISYLLERHKEDPLMNPIRRGTIFDNPQLSRVYLREECAKYTGQRAREELLGEVFFGTAGALWSLDVIEMLRRYTRPTEAEQRAIAVDPALSADPSADETGIVGGARGSDGHTYVEDDLSGHHTGEAWGLLVVDWCLQHKASGAIVERNHLGDHARAPIVAAAKTRGVQTRLLPRGDALPRHMPGVIYIAEKVSHVSKMDRAHGAAAETAAGRVHHVGTFGNLELQLCTFDGSGKSPNRFDAAAMVITELAGLGQDIKQPATESVVQASAVATELITRLNSLASRSRTGL